MGMQFDLIRMKSSAKIGAASDVDIATVLVLSMANNLTENGFMRFNKRDGVMYVELDLPKDELRVSLAKNTAVLINPFGGRSPLDVPQDELVIVGENKISHE